MPRRKRDRSSSAGGGDSPPKRKSTRLQQQQQLQQHHLQQQRQHSISPQQQQQQSYGKRAKVEAAASAVAAAATAAESSAAAAAAAADDAAMQMLPIESQRCLQWVNSQHALIGGLNAYELLPDMDLSDMEDDGGDLEMRHDDAVDVDNNSIVVLKMDPPPAPQQPLANITEPTTTAPATTTNNTTTSTTSDGQQRANAKRPPATTPATTTTTIIAKKPAAGPKAANTNRKVALACEWNRCTQLADTYADLCAHLNTVHRLAAGLVPPQPLRLDGTYECGWDLCTHSTPSWLELRCHAYQHANHTHLKSVGEALLGRKKCAPCLVNSCRRNQLPDVPTATEYACEWRDCADRFEQMFELCEHVRKHVDFERSQRRKPPGSKLMRCGWALCDKEMELPWRLVDHCRLHVGERQMACPNCGSTFTSYSKFYAHFYRQAEEKPFQCVHCFKNFANEDLLTSHMYFHVNCYKCTLCDMTCPSPSALAKHMRQRHIATKPFACRECPFGAKLKKDLERHIMTQHEQHVYECDEFDCDFETTSYYMMRMHDKRVHCGLGPSTYACHCCAERFRRGNQLSDHLIAEHQFQLPSGHSRFTFMPDLDGMFRVQTMRMESLEVTQAIMSPSRSDRHAADLQAKRANVTYKVSEVQTMPVDHQSGGAGAGSDGVMLGVVVSALTTSTEPNDADRSPTAGSDLLLSMPRLRFSEDDTSSDATLDALRRKSSTRKAKTAAQRRLAQRQQQPIQLDPPTQSSSSGKIKNIQDFSVMKRYLRKENTTETKIVIELTKVDASGNVLRSETMCADEFRVE